jgi:mono/diheme cytochrome c family protein
MKRKNIAWVAVSVLMSGLVLAQTAEKSSATRLQAGKKTYDYWCATCHGAERGLPGIDELPGTQQLRLKYRGTKTSPLLEERTDLVPEFVKTVVRHGVSFMPHFRKTEISDAQLDDLAAYLARNNSAVKK